MKVKLPIEPNQELYFVIYTSNQKFEVEKNTIQYEITNINNRYIIQRKTLGIYIGREYEYKPSRVLSTHVFGRNVFSDEKKAKDKAKELNDYIEKSLICTCPRCATEIELSEHDSFKGNTLSDTSSACPRFECPLCGYKIELNGDVVSDYDFYKREIKNIIELQNKKYMN